MMRLLILEFIKDLHIDVRDDALGYVSEAQGAVGVTDFDFEIVPTAQTQREEVTHQQVMINSAILLWVREYIASQLYDDVSSMRERDALIDNSWDYAEAENELLMLLRAEVASISSDHPLHGATIDHVHIRHPRRAPPMFAHRTRNGRSYPEDRIDQMMFSCPSKESASDSKESTLDDCIVPLYDVLREIGCHAKTLAMATRTSKNPVYVTTNMHIGEREPRAHKYALTTDFHLSRIKHSFIMYYTTTDGRPCVDRLSGELIDLSQSHHGLRDESHRHLMNEVPTVYRRYNIVGTPYYLRGYTTRAILHEIQDVLHHGQTAPWESSKLKKRLLRYMLILGMQVLSETPGVEHAMAGFEILLKYLSSPRAIRTQRMRRSGVDTIDVFADHEHMSAAYHPQTPQMMEYYATMQKHLRKFIDVIRMSEEGKKQFAWRTTSLNALYIEHDE